MNNARRDEKERIRQKYKGIDVDKLDVIPALPSASLDDDSKMQRVAVYARVSTDDPRQTSSYELQKNHYEDVVKHHPGWKLINIYADEGISGTSLKHRDAFVQMIADCKAGKIDLILTKSVSRFARNILDCIGYARQLAAMQPPIGIFFETERIYTLNSNSEMSLSFIATLAQEESHTKSEIMNASIEMRFRRGIFLTPVLLGYDHDEDGNLIVNEDEAQTVRLIFFMYLYGFSTQQIADTLTELKRPSKKGNITWSSSSILQILQNERHCGDVLARKTWTPSYLDHKSKKNRQDRNQYRQKEHHEAIISRDDFIAVQRLIANAKYGNKGFLPELKVITSGILKGFVSVNPRWAGFKVDDYLEASESAYDPEESLSPTSYEARDGDFDLRDFQIVRGQFFDTARKVSMTFTSNRITFSTEAIHKLDSLYIEILVNPKLMILAIRADKKDGKNAIQWRKVKDGSAIPRIISGTAFIPTLFKLFNWKTEYRYRITGTLKHHTTESVLLFDISEPEVFISPEALPVTATSSNVVAYPEQWASSFGNNYYEQSQKNNIATNNMEKWGVHNDGDVYASEAPENLTSKSELSSNIQTLITTMKQEAATNDN